ncbi:MAG: hypothetical protein Q9221_001483 [Calogaya cf. arnoldii]
MKSISRGEEYMSDLILGHRDTLKCLCLGAETHVLRDYHVSHEFNEFYHDTLPIRERYVDELVDSLEFLRESDDLRPWLSLRDLQLVGLNVRKFVKPASKIIDFQFLSSLSLKTCPGLAAALDILATESNESGLPLRSCLRLRSFSLRHEKSNRNFRTRLIKFLSAIQGLTHLSILLENSDRSKPRDLDPLLALTGEAFAPLKNLKTLNIRNMPFIDPKKMALPISEIYSSFANSLLRILLCSDKDVLNPSAPQNLKTLALGALTYRDVYNGVAFDRTLDL